MHAEGRILYIKNIWNDEQALGNGKNNFSSAGRAIGF